ncbi:MAG: hypothetical protein L6416_02875, partial [Candidatus Omnitrophica bacterium]|nr:hypothetical protein [Candidatus Omnitrophota bacterium]
LFEEVMKRIYAWAVSKKKLSAKSAKEQIGTALAKEAKRTFKIMDGKLYTISSPEAAVNEEYIRDSFGASVFSAQEYAQKRGISVEKAKNVLEQLWRKSDNIDHVKLGNGEAGYWYNSIGVAIQLGSNTMPEDIPAGAVMRVIVGHSAVMERGMTVEQKKAQLDAFLAAGDKIIYPFGDFPETLRGVDYLKGGQRKFAMDFEGIREQARSFGTQDSEYSDLFAVVSKVQAMQTMHELIKEYADYFVVLPSVVGASFKKMLADASKDKNAVALVKDVRGQDQIDVGALLLKQYPEHAERILKALGKRSLFITVADFKMHLAGKIQIRELAEFQNNVINFMLNDRAMVKELIIKEISTVYDINSQVRALFKDIPVSQILNQIKLSYEPVEGIKTVAISAFLQVLRKEKMIEELVRTSISDKVSEAQAMEIAKALGYSSLSDVDGEALSQKLYKLRVAYKAMLEGKIIYGGGANAANFKEVSGVWGNAGAFIGRAILKVDEAVKIAVSAANAQGRPDVIMNFKAERDGSLKEWIDALKAADMDLAKDVKVTLGVLLHDAILTMRELQGADVSDLLQDYSNAGLDLTIDARTAEVGIESKGPCSGNIPAEFLRRLGVKTVVVDGMQPDDAAKMQVGNLMRAGIFITAFDTSKATPIGELRTKAAAIKMMRAVNTPVSQEISVLIDKAI